MTPLIRSLPKWLDELDISLLVKNEDDDADVPENVGVVLLE